MSGHLSMDSVLRNNRNLSRKGREYTKKKNFKGREGEITLKEMSKEDLQLLQIKIAKAKKKENIKLLIISTIILIPVIWFVYAMFNGFVQNMNNGLYTIELLEKNKSEKEIKEIKSVTLPRYKLQIIEGDRWIENKNWKNAIYFYEKAVDLYPEKYEANYRLALAYSYHCQYKDLDCKIGSELNEKLLKYFPEDTKVLELKHIFDRKN